MGEYYIGTEEETSVETRISDLPDIFMISVFKYFTLKERIKLSSICKKWKSLLKDASLWNTIDLRPYKNEISLNDLKKIISLYGCESTKHFLISGNYSYHYTSRLNEVNLNDENSKIAQLDAHFIKDILAFKCSQIQTVIMEYLDLDSLNFEDFISLTNLKTLSFKWCNLNSNFFTCETNKKVRIEHLYLIKTGKLMLEDVKTICFQTPFLKTLCINQAQSSIKDDSVEFIVKHLNNLERLELTNTLISDQAIKNICESKNLANNLQFLNVSMSSCLTNNCLLYLSEKMHNLKSLYLTSCFGISNVRILQNFVNLRYLNLNNTSIEREKIRESLLPVLPKCEIDFGHEKMLNRKLMWTINGSRNCVCSF